MYEFNISDPLFLPQYGCELQLKLKAGHCLILVGENGIGKSTLLRRICSLHKEASFLEQGPLEVFYDRRLSEISRIFSQISPQLNKLRLERLWDDFGLSHKENRLLSRLSGGEAQALKICLTLSKETNLYCLDEPSQYLDDLKKRTLSSFIQKLLNEGKALVIAEHDQSWVPGPTQVIHLVLEGNVLKGRPL